MCIPRWLPASAVALAVVVAALEGKACDQDGATSGTCSGQGASKKARHTLRDWSFLQVATRRPKLEEKASTQDTAHLVELEEKASSQESAMVHSENSMHQTKPQPNLFCCMAMTAACLACKAGMTVDEFCASAESARATDCPPAAGAASTTLMQPTTTPSPSLTVTSVSVPSSTTSKPDRNCCLAMTADCLACQEGIPVQDYCARPQHADVEGCDFSVSPTAAPSPSPKVETNGTKQMGCDFETEPLTPYFWDETCQPHGLGCFADGVHGPCRFCGEGAYTSIQCPSCTFQGTPPASHHHYWDNECRRDSKRPGCWADGIHAECRFCGTGKFASITCPSWVLPSHGRCAFTGEGEPSSPYYWEPMCRRGMLGCWADGKQPECRWCGVAPYDSIPCPP